MENVFFLFIQAQLAISTCLVFLLSELEQLEGIKIAMLRDAPDEVSSKQNACSNNKNLVNFSAQFFVLFGLKQKDLKKYIFRNDFDFKKCSFVQFYCTLI